MDRVETTIADEIAESLFVDFNGKNAYLGTCLP